MKTHNTKSKGKKVLSMLLALVMVLSVASPAFSPMLGLTAKAAAEFDVELAFDNLFVFDHWVTNGNSMIIDNDFGSTNAGTITEIDFENGSFRFTNNTNHNIYTRAAAGTGDKTEENFDYYRMPVKAGASYTFSCNFTGTSPAFYPHVFFYTESNEFTGTLINGTFTGNGDYSFNFTVPEGASYIQLRLAIAGNDTKDAYAVIKDIAISRYKFEMDSTNLFSLDSWVGSEKSDQPATSFVAYNDGRVTPQDSNSDGSYDRLYFETNVDNTNGVGLFFTDFDYTSYEGYYSMDVKPNTDYTLSYNISGGNALDFQPYIVRYDSDGKFIDFINYVTLNYGVSNFTFTTTATTEYIAVVFSISHQNQSWNLTVQDIGVYETTITDYTVDPVRETYVYNSSNNGTYGTLPTPPAETYPEGYIFAGWYTEMDGKGIRITADTEILPQSMTVYPKFEPEVDTLAVKTLPTKTTYTIGEKINTAGLVLTYGIETVVTDTDEEGNIISTETVIKTTDISSGFYIDPQYAQDTAGTQTITVHYGGKTAKFTITVSDGVDKSILVNGNTHAVKVANNNYTINYQATAPFNRYELTYSSDSYVKGEIVMDGVTEEFFLEPSGNGSFASYIDSFLRGVSHYNVDSIKFTCLDNEFGNFELLSVTTIAATIPSNPTQYYENTETGYKVGIDLSFGGVVSEIYDLNNTEIESRVYNIDGKYVTKVDYAEILDTQYGTDCISKETGAINLINKFDRGRYLQQSYYGTSQKPYELGDYNGEDWPYNPVQGGNLMINNADGTTKGNEASKVIDYRITNDQIYIKTRPLDWGKNSEDYPDSYVTDSYMEAWYVFEDGMIKTYCRFVDFSGYPSHTRDQELPAVYIIEPLNHFVYNNVADGSEWTTTNYKKIKEPDFWGVLPSYNEVLINNGMSAVDPTVDCYENWAAFAASDDENSFGVGVYSAGVTDFHYGCFFPIYQEEAAKNGQLVATENRHAFTLNPAEENPTSYISPVGNMTFESYKPFEYSYYITTGTANDIYSDFKEIAQKDADAALDATKIAVPETVYMTPADGASKVGQYYVNNILDDSYNIVTEAERDAGMYLGLHVKDAATFSVKITNVTDPSNDIFLCNTSGSEISENARLSFDVTDTFEARTQYGLRFSGAGLSPGETATAKWEITVYLDDGTTKNYTAYTVLYAPGRTIGAVAEGRYDSAANTEISSWITGANGVDHSQRAPLGSFHGDYRNSGYFKMDPLVYPDTLPTGGSSETSSDYILGYGAQDADDYTNNSYVMQTATDGSDGSRSQSYLGLLAIDKSRYTNTNQIPNLKMGYDILRVGSAETDSLATYTTYYTLGTAESYTSTSLSEAPSGWTQKSTYSKIASGNANFQHRETETPNYSVSDDIDGKYIHALNQGVSESMNVFDWITTNKRYATAGTSVLIDVTDKSALRDAVLEGYAQNNSTPELDKALENAATVLGDPSADQNTIEEAKKELENELEKVVDTYYALKYDNLFSAYEFSQHSGSMTVTSNRGTVAYENGTITVVNGTITGGEAYTNYGSSDDYYKVVLKPNTEYVFEYDVTTNVRSQAFMFFYKEDGSNGDVPTNMSVQTNGGDWQSHSETNPWFGNYGGSDAYHYVIKFTTGANTFKASFRFGNDGNDPNTSTFSNIKLVESSKYYSDVDYPKTEDVYKEYASYGILPTPTRTGYTFAGWSDENGTGITGATIATEHKSVYSQWDEHTYTITYNANGGNSSGSNETTGKIKYTDNVILSDGLGFEKNGYNFVGWSTDKNATAAEFTPGATVSKLTDVNNGTVTLYAVWQNAIKNEVAYENLFVFSDWAKTDSAKGNNSSVGSLSIDAEAGTITVAGVGTSGAEIDYYTLPNCGADYYSAPVTAGEKYTLKYTATGDGTKHQAFVYFYDSNNVGVTSSLYNNKNYTSKWKQSPGKNIELTVTIPEGATQVAFRFGPHYENETITFSDISFYSVDRSAEIGLENWENRRYRDTDISEIYIPERDGYTFNGWYVDENRNGSIDDTEIQFDASEHSLDEQSYVLLSDWAYQVYFSANGPDVTIESKKLSSITSITLPDALDDWQGATFVGWSIDSSANPYVTSGIYAAGSTFTVDYITDGALNENGGITLHAIWKLGDDCCSPDTQIIDFGLPVTFNPYENDNPAIITQAMNVCKNDFLIGFNTDGSDSFTTNSIETEYGSFAFNENAEVTFTPDGVLNESAQVYYFTQLNYPDGTKKTFKNTITVSPASNVYYEEDMLIIAESDNVDWASKGTKASAVQSASSASDIYGYDEAYNNTNSFSDGTYLQANVTSTNKKSDTASFTFKGTGFDLISACGENTGVQIVKISKLQDDKVTYKAVKAIIVDTYFTDTGIMNGDLLYQVPVVNYRGDYGTYKVETTATYLNSAGAVKSGTATIAYSSATLSDGTTVKTSSSEPSKALLNELEELGFDDLGKDIEVVWMDDNSAFNGGTGSLNASIFSGSAKVYYADGETTTVAGLRNYIDGVRVYNPLNGGETYYKDSEQNATYYNIVTELELDSSAADKNMAYIESKDLGFSLIFGSDFNFDAYNEQGGPKGELYLKKGDAIAFKFNAETNGDDAAAMLGMRAVKGTANASVYTASTQSNPYTKEISSATEMYYDISPAVTVKNGEVTIIVANTGEGILAVNNLKLVNGKLSAADTIDQTLSNNIGNGNVAAVPTPVVPDAVQGEAGNVEDIPGTDVDTETNAPETDTETDIEETESDISVAIPGLPAPIASFLEMLFNLLGQLVGSLGF